MAVIRTLPAATYYLQPNGVDDTADIGTVFSLLAGAASAKIILTDGVYKVSSQIAYAFQANQNITLEGQGSARIISTVPEPTQEGGIFNFTGDSGATAKLTIRNLTISHTYTGPAGVGLLDGIFVQPLNYGSGGTQSLASICLDEVEISGASKEGASILGAQKGAIWDCSMHGNRDAGLFLIGVSDIDVVGGNYSNNVSGTLTGDYGISFASSSFLPYSQNCLVIGVQANGNGRKGLDVHHGHKIHFLGNTCEGNGYCGIYAVMENSSKDVGDITITGNTIDQTGGNGSLTQNAIQIGTFGATGALSPGAFIVANNKIKGVDAPGNAFSNAIRIMTASSGAAPERVSVIGNTVENGAGPSGYMIDVDPNLSIEHLEIANNTLHAAGGTYGAIIQSGVDIVVSGNTIRIDSGTSLVNFLNIVSSANALVVGNQCNGASIATPITNSSATHLLRANQANGGPIPDTGDFSTSGNIFLTANNKFLKGKDQAGNTYQIAGYDATNAKQLNLGDSTSGVLVLILNNGKISGTLEVTGAVTLDTGLSIDAKGHLLSTASGTPTLSSINANVTNTRVSGNDTRGTISFDTQTGTIAAGTALFTVNFSQTYGSTPVILLTTGPSNQTTSSFYTTSDAPGSFTVCNSAALAVAIGYKVKYAVWG